MLAPYLPLTSVLRSGWYFSDYELDAASVEWIARLLLLTCVVARKALRQMSVNFTVYRFKKNLRLRFQFIHASLNIFKSKINALFPWGAHSASSMHIKVSIITCSIIDANLSGNNQASGIWHASCEHIYLSKFAFSRSSTASFISPITLDSTHYSFKN